MLHHFARTVSVAAIAASLLAGAVLAADLDPKAVTWTPLDKIQWKDNAAGTNASAMIYGDLAKPEPYADFVKWKAGNMSRPHWHPNDRYITVLSGTWWVGTGTKFDPDSTVPMTAGSFVTHFGKQVHYDGAKDADCVL